MFQLDLKSRIPIYEQIVENIKRLIITGILKQDEKLMSVRELSKLLTLNPNTIQKSYRELERQGYIYSIPGKGNFVSGSIKGSEQEILKEVEEKMDDVLSEAIYRAIPKEKIIEMVDRKYDKFMENIKGE